MNSVIERNGVSDVNEFDACSVSRAMWIEAAIRPRNNRTGDTVLYVYQAPSKRWNGMLYAGILHVGDVVGCETIDEVKIAVGQRAHVPSAVKEFKDIESLRAEMIRVGQISAFA